MLVDEVDVFFGPEFYGQTHNQVALLEAPEVREILIKIWEKRADADNTGKLVRMVQKTTEYKALLRTFPDWKFLIEAEVATMCRDLKYFEEPHYQYDARLDRIGYAVMDGFCYDLVWGYRTAFAFLKHSPRNAEASVRRALQLRLSCGRFSYANIKPACILGVSGTLEALGEYEWRVMSSYGFASYSLLPSVYGPSNFRFLDQTGGNPITVNGSVDDYHLAITNEVSQKVSQGRAVIVFFKDSGELEKYLATSYYRKIANRSLLRENQSHSEKEYVIKKAATSGQATFTTAVFGRGTDFVCNDTKLLNAGGVHVVQTFIASDLSEEKQIQGRTARQGKAGTYSMVLLGEELKSLGLDPDSAMRQRPAELYDKLKSMIRQRCLDASKKREEQLEVAKKDDTLTHEYFDALLKADRGLATKKFKELYNGKLKKQGPSNPQAGGRVHFTGVWLADFIDNDIYSRIPYQRDEYGEYVGVGEYPDNMKAFPNSIAHTFDAVAVDAGTRVTIFSKPNFEGEVLWDKVGPAIIANSLWMRDSRYAPHLHRMWKEPLNSIFPPQVREWSCTNMHAWNTGSLIIQDGEAIPQQLKDTVPEYAHLDNQTY